MERIVVGLDSSDPARRALLWAVDLSGCLGGVPVLAIHVCEDVEAAYEKGFCNRAQADEWLAESESEARDILRDAMAEMGLDEAEVPVSLQTIPGRPAAALLDAVTAKDLLVVGPRGLGRFRGLLGSVSQTCLTHAPCPVVVVRYDTVES